jgi:hypothetical protein
VYAKHLKVKIIHRFGHIVAKCPRVHIWPLGMDLGSMSKNLRYTTSLGRKLLQRNNQRLSRLDNDKWRDLLQVQNKLTWPKVWHKERSRFRKEVVFMWSMWHRTIVVNTWKVRINNSLKHTCPCYILLGLLNQSSTILGVPSNTKNLALNCQYYQ